MPDEAIAVPENRIHLGNLGPGDVALLKQVSDEAARKAVHDAFMVMGLDLDKPIESQQNFAVLRELSVKVTDPENRADALWVRQTRVRMDGIFGKAILTAVGLAVVGAAHTLWTGFTSLIGKP